MEPSEEMTQDETDEEIETCSSSDLSEVDDDNEINLQMCMRKVGCRPVSYAGSFLRASHRLSGSNVTQIWP